MGDTTETEGRSEGLAKKLSDLGGNFVGGIVIKKNRIWHYNDSINYEYTKGKLNGDWKLHGNLFNSF